MKLLISFFILACTIQANATVYDYGVEMVRPDGCEFRWPFHEQGTPEPEGVAWKGKCVGNKAEGYGLMFEMNSSTSYFMRYSAGKNHPFVMEIKNGVAKPVFLSATGVGVTPDYDGCRKYKKECDLHVQMYNEMKSSLPKNPYAGKSDNNSGKNSGSSSGGGNSSSSVGALGPVTPPPADFLRAIKGERVACTEAALGALGNKMMDKYGAELRTNSMCTVARGTAKAHYEVIISIEKSCPPEKIPQVADMQPLREVLQSALDTIHFSCP
ncbi:hypothetical protein DOM22_14220 [Bdellovibrio sp. ZAP7]|uniref:hypothetical protein n=1 Tax=Bdellovibrio sp. ZAP7 TaxID=2231053 RepID=UPI00115C0D3D|nr:hypothetical protein [Bdellovibrio sp. ZAP7]QDK46236.1 hypothetical protein DOM22_14220 [Bdellovibrio sp. ZAP7]